MAWGRGRFGALPVVVWSYFWVMGDDAFVVGTGMDDGGERRRRERKRGNQGGLELEIWK